MEAYLNANIAVLTQVPTDTYRVLMKHFMDCRRVYELCMEVVVCREEDTYILVLPTIYACITVRPSPHHRRTKRVFQYYASPRLILDNPVQGSA